jgi:hypothetical protein
MIDLNTILINISWNMWGAHGHTQIHGDWETSSNISLQFQPHCILVIQAGCLCVLSLHYEFPSWGVHIKEVYTIIKSSINKIVEEDLLSYEFSDKYRRDCRLFKTPFWQLGCIDRNEEI